MNHGNNLYFYQLDNHDLNLSHLDMFHVVFCRSLMDCRLGSIGYECLRGGAMGRGRGGLLGLGVSFRACRMLLISCFLSMRNLGIMASISRRKICMLVCLYIFICQFQTQSFILCFQGLPFGQICLYKCCSQELDDKWYDCEAVVSKSITKKG